MNIILGFGSTEEAYRNKVKKDIEAIVSDCLSEKFVSLYDLEFNDEIWNSIDTEVRKYAEETVKAASEDKSERYSYVYITYARNCSNLFFGLSFNHINTRHPMSSDGMAMLQVKDCHWISLFDFKDGSLKVKLKSEIRQ